MFDYRLRFFDEDAQDALHRDQGSSVDPADPPRFEPAAFVHKNLQMMGVTVRCEEFPEQQRQSVWVVSPSSSPSSADLVEDGSSKGKELPGATLGYCKIWDSIALNNSFRLYLFISLKEKYISFCTIF